MDKISLKNQLKIVQKNLGKGYYNHNISEDTTKSSSFFLLLGVVFTIFIIGSLWYVYFCLKNDYYTLALALFLSIGILNIFDTIKKLLYKQYLYIGSRGIALLSIKISLNIVSNNHIIYFKDFDNITIDEKYHYRAGVGGELVEHLIIRVNNNKILDINKNKTKDYEKIKDILVEQYEIYQINNKQKVNVHSNNESFIQKHYLVLIALSMIVLNIVYFIFDIDYYSKIVSLASIISICFIMIIGIKIAVHKIFYRNDKKW